MNITIEFSIFKLVKYHFQLKLINAIFWTKFAKKDSFCQCKTDKIDTTAEYCIFELVFEQTILNFWNKIAQERYSWSKTEKVNIIIELQLFKLVLVPKFSLN